MIGIDDFTFFIYNAIDSSILIPRRGLNLYGFSEKNSSHIYSNYKLSKS